MRKTYLMTKNLLKLATATAVKSLNLHCNPEHLNDVSDENDPIEIVIKKF